MTKTNITIRLMLIILGFFAVSKGASLTINPLIEDPLTSLMLIKWVTAVYVIGLAYWLKISSKIGLTYEKNWKSLGLYWPIALLAVFSLANGWNSTEISLLLTVALFAIAVGIGEEVIFRGFFFHYLREMKPVSIILISSLAFGAIHLGWLFKGVPLEVVLVQVYFAVGVGVIFGNAKARFGGLAIPIFVHAALDFVALGAKGSVEEVLSIDEKPAYDEQIIFGMLFAGTIVWAWGIWLLYIGKRRNNFIQFSPES